jgi:TP901 family phage tail tape measure protein
MAISAGTVTAEMILDTSKYEDGLRKAEEHMNSFGSRMEKAGAKMAKIGDTLTKKVTLPLATMGAAAAKASIDFESSFAGVKKTVDATDKQLDVLKKGIRDMSKEIPASATAIAEVAEAAGQLGIETDNILGFTRVMIDLGESTNLSANDAATALARLANITGMSQKDFDRLGSTIVALGNNLATTESEIVEMGLRLAGAGSQVGMTEAQIMSFAGALSSVGIEAEAGGSAFSKVMVDMQLAVETNSGALEDYGRVAGMTGQEFKKAFQEDAAGAIVAFIEGLGNMDGNGQSAIKTLDDMGISEVRMRDALLRAAGASDVFTDALALGTDAWDENNALTKEAQQRYETTASKIEIMKNKLVDVGITIGDIVVPPLMDLIGGVEKAVNWFAQLDKGTQETIVKMAALAMAVGPVLKVGAGLIKGVGAVKTALGGLSIASTATAGAASAAGGAAATAGAGFSAMGLAGSAAGLLLNPVGLTIAGIGVAGVIAAKKLSEDAIPAVELFGEECSEATKEAVGGFLELEEQATLSLNQLAWSGQEVTAEMAESISGNFDEMKNQIVGKLEEQRAQAVESVQSMCAESKNLTEQEQAEMLVAVTQGYDERMQITEDGTRRINEILAEAAKNGGKIEKEQQEEMNRIKQQMKEEGIKVLSESEKEQLAIMERLKSQSGEISALQAAEVVKNSKKQKEETIKQAEEEYNERLKIAAELRAQGGAEAEAAADKIVEEAERQYEETVKNAEQMHKDVVGEAKAQTKEHVNEVDWETGEVKSKWQVAVGSVSDAWDDWKKNASDTWSSVKQVVQTGNKQCADNMKSKWDDACKKTNSALDSFKDKADDSWGKVTGYIGKGISKLDEWNKKPVKDKEATFTQKVRTIGDRILSGLGFNAQGTSYWRGGLTWVGEEGPELISLPRGTKIFSNPESLHMAAAAAASLQSPPITGSRAVGRTRTTEASPVKGGNINQYITINSPEPLTPSETARKHLQVSRQLAMEWGL